MALLRSLVFFILLLIVTIVWSIVSMLAFVTPYRTRYRIITCWNHIILWCTRWVLGIRYEISGIDNIPDEPCVVVSRHESAFETILFPTIFKPQTWVLKKELLYLPFFGWGIALLNPIAINRKAGKSALAQVINQGIKHLESKIWVVVFPEGTRMAPHQSKRFKIGGLKLALVANTKILPVALNSGDFWPRNAFVKHPGTVKIVIGPVIDTTDKKIDGLVAETQSWILEQTDEVRVSPASKAEMRSYVK